MTVCIGEQCVPSMRGTGSRARCGARWCASQACAPLVWQAALLSPFLGACCMVFLFKQTPNLPLPPGIILGLVYMGEGDLGDSNSTDVSTVSRADITCTADLVPTLLH